jgi:sulfatase maturation enzyme AslB (radical SAM superfamily)
LHWKILEELDKHKRYNVGLIYNTNLLKLTYKDKNAIDIWEKFKDRVYVGVSVDAIDKRAEYVRYGTDWNVIHNNIKSLQNSNIKFQLDTCISNLNIAGLVELFDYVDRMKISSINLSNILQYPNYMHISQMPTSIKNNVVIKIKEYASSCKNKILKNIIINWIPVLESSFFEDKTNDLIPEFLNHIKELDKIRNTNLYDACPEWKVVL